MKTKIAATLVALACVASIGFPAAAADDASTARTQSAATATLVQDRPETSGQFVTLFGVRADALSSEIMDSTRGGAKATFVRTKPHTSPSTSESFTGLTILSTNFSTNF